ncbi:MAG TPA: TadE/TadG family type IV pilus assembly protein [Pirellulaceae bacterium]|nr:TadE/TadG family type IV pilus assembly protein [Pirellulaceae bacterium]
MRPQAQRKSHWRIGAVTVEFAILAPVFVTLVMGVTECSRLYDLKSQFSMAAREGARLAAMDRTGLTTGGVTTNAKITADVKNYLKASGLDPNDIDVKIVGPVELSPAGTPQGALPTGTFNLDDPANSLKYFAVKVSVPSTKVMPIVPSGMSNSFGGTAVFRNIKL